MLILTYMYRWQVWNTQKRAAVDKSKVNADNKRKSGEK